MLCCVEVNTAHCVDQVSRAQFMVLLIVGSEELDQEHSWPRGLAQFPRDQVALGGVHSLPRPMEETAHLGPDQLQVTETLDRPRALLGGLLPAGRGRFPLIRHFSCAILRVYIHDMDTRPEYL